MYCSKCLCPQLYGECSIRHSCRVHTIVNNKCLYCGVNYKGKNCKHDWTHTSFYYINSFINLCIGLKNKILKKK